MKKVKFFSKKILKAPALIIMFLLSLILISFGAKSLIAALNSDNSTVNDYTVTFPTNLEGISENGIQYAVAKKSTKFIGTYESYGNWQPTAGINSINIKNGDKIKFLVKFNEGYSHLKISDVKLSDSDSTEAFSLKVYDYNNGSVEQRDPNENETIIPGQNYPTSELKVNKNLNLSFSGIKSDNYSVKISMKENPEKTKEALDAYYYFSNESEMKKINFSEKSGSYELNGLTYNSGINLIIKRTAPYTQTELDLNDLEGISEFTNKSKIDSGIRLNTAVNKNYDIKINQDAEKNKYEVKNNTSNTIEYKLSNENEYKTLANEDSFTATHGENYDFKYTSLEKTLIANKNVIHKSNDIYSLYNISENVELSSAEELSETNVPIYLPVQENGILIVDESGENQLADSNIKYGNSFSFRLKQVEGYTQNFDDIEVYKNNVLGNEKTLLSPNRQNAADECSGLYTITDIRQPIKIETSKPIKNVYKVSVAQNLKNAKVEVSGQNVILDENTKDLGTKDYSVEDNSGLEITVTPNSGYSTENMILDVNADVSPEVSLSNNKFTVSSVRSNTTLSVENVQEIVNINFSSGYKYTDAINQTQNINKGETFSFSLKENYDDNNFIVKSNGTQLQKGDDGKYTLSNIQEDQNITIEPDSSKKVDITVGKIPSDVSISYKIGTDTNTTKLYSQNENTTINISLGSTITFSHDTSDGVGNLSIKISNESKFKKFDENNEYKIEEIISPLTISFLKDTDIKIQAWSLAKTYKLGIDENNTVKTEDGNGHGDYKIKFQDQPTDIEGTNSYNNGQSFDVKFKKVEGKSDDISCQGWSKNGENWYSYFGPQNLNIKLDYGTINNLDAFEGFRVDGIRADGTIDKDIFNLTNLHNNNESAERKQIKNNIGQTVNNYEYPCSTQKVEGTEQTFSFLFSFSCGIRKYLATPNIFKKLTNSFATMFTFYNPDDLLGDGSAPTNNTSTPLSTRYFKNYKEYNLPPNVFDSNLYPVILYQNLVNGHSIPQDYQSNSVDNFSSLIVSQNLNFDRDGHNKKDLFDGNLNYNIKPSHILPSNYIYSTYNSTLAYVPFIGYWKYGYPYAYNSRFFNILNNSKHSTEDIKTESTDYGTRTWYNYYYPKEDNRYYGVEINNPEAQTNSNSNNISITSSFYKKDNEIQNEDVTFAYLYDEIILTPIFENAQYATTCEIDFPPVSYQTDGMEFYETYYDNNDNPQKSIKLTKNKYTITGSNNDESLKFDFIIKTSKDYDFDPNSVNTFPNGFAQVTYNGDRTYSDPDDNGTYYFFTINQIYSDKLSIHFSAPQKHKYRIECKDIASNFYDVYDGEKFLVKNIESGSELTFETEQKIGYEDTGEKLTVYFGTDHVEINDRKEHPLSGNSTIQLISEEHALRNKYKISNLNSDLVIEASRKRRKLNVRFTYYDAFKYMDSSGTNQLRESEEKTDFDYPVDYGNSLYFIIKEEEGYDSTKLAITANGTPVEYTNGQYRIKNITENLVIKAENVEKIKCKLVFMQHEGIKFKDSKDNVLPSEKELQYKDNFTFKTEISNAYAQNEENYQLVLELASGKRIYVPLTKGNQNSNNNTSNDNNKENEETNITADTNNPNIYHLTNIKENCRVYIEGLEHKKHKIKLYNSEGIVFQDKYGTAPLDKDSSKKVITETTLHGQTFSFKIKANEGYDISGMKLFAKKDESGIREQLFPSNDVYTIENVTEDYTVTLENVEKTKYSVEIRLTEGAKCVDQNGDTMNTNLTVSHGEDLSFYISLDSAYSKASPTVTMKGTINQIMPDASGKYTISNITENKIVEISGVKKNTYKATFVDTEGVIYKNNKNKPFENSLDVEYGETLYFKITLMDAYDKSTPLVMMNDNKVIAESAGVYTVANIDSDITITVKNVNKNPEEVTMDDVNNVPESVVTEDDINSVVTATLTYENLSDEEKAQVTNTAALEKAQKEAGELNHRSGNIYVNGLDWNIKIIATELTNDEEKLNYLNSKIDRRELINLYDIYLLDLLTGKTYELPYGQSVDVTMPAPNNLTGYKNIVVAHEKSSGNIEYLDVNITDETVKFTATSFSLFGLAAKKTPNYSESPSSTQISVAGLVENEEELKALLGEGIVSQIGDLTQPDSSLTSSENQGDSSENSYTPLSLWNRFYKWALNNEFLIVLLILLLGSGAIWLILLLAKKHQNNEEN